MTIPSDALARDLARERRREINEEVFEQRLKNALNVALGNQTALVIVPTVYSKSHVVSRLVHLLDDSEQWKPYLRATQDAVHFEGTRGSVRIYSANHIEYHTAEKRMIGYPHGTPTFLHPEVEGL